MRNLQTAARRAVSVPFGWVHPSGADQTSQAHPVATRLAAAGLAILLATLGMGAAAFAAPLIVPVSIVDTPRPLEKWGYMPTVVKVASGAWVTWSNSGQDPHTVTALDTTFDSDMILPGEGFSWYFDQEGTFAYMCSVHPWMKGRVIVGSGRAVADPAPTTAADDGATVDPNTQPQDTANTGAPDPSQGSL